MGTKKLPEDDLTLADLLDVPGGTCRAQDVLRVLGCSHLTLYRLINSGVIPRPFSVAKHMSLFVTEEVRSALRKLGRRHRFRDFREPQEVA